MVIPPCEKVVPELLRQERILGIPEQFTDHFRRRTLRVKERGHVQKLDGLRRELLDIDIRPPRPRVGRRKLFHLFGETESRGGSLVAELVLEEFLLVRDTLEQDDRVGRNGFRDLLIKAGLPMCIIGIKWTVLPSSRTYCRAQTANRSGRTDRNPPLK